MLPEHKNSINGHNAQNLNKIQLEPIKLEHPTEEIAPISTLKEFNQHQNSDTIINFQTITTGTINHDPETEDYPSNIKNLGNTPKKDHHRKRSKAKKSKSKKRRNPWLSFQDNFTETRYRSGRRINGIQLPLHPLQIFGWIVLILFGLVSFIVLIPSFPVEVRQPLYGLLSGLYIVHTISHLAALLIDPADSELRLIHRNDRIVPEFDRSKHSHVIENGRCHLCNIRTTSNRTKHCSVCNKCVGKFDHHCKWLNHCIGGRNYVAFLMCVVSAVIATLVIVAASIAQICLYYLNPDWLSLWYSTKSSTHLASEAPPLNDTLIVTSDEILSVDDSLGLFNQTFDDEKVTNLTTAITEAIATAMPINQTGGDASNNTTSGIGVNDTIFLVFIGFIGVLAAITAGLLLHLCFFHIYISFLGLTTYEYIRNQRQQNATPQESATTNQPSTDPSKSQIYFCSNLAHPNNDFNSNSNANSIRRPKSLHCCENSREYHQSTSLKTIYMCSLLEERTTATSDRLHHIHHHSNGTEDKTKLFHCCSHFKKQQEAESPAAAVTRRRSVLHFSEQCTFCTIRIKTPTKPEPDKRCCLKTISKHHRWRRKWNCCANVPDSPDVPNDLISTISGKSQMPNTIVYKSSRNPVHEHIIKTNGSGGGSGAGGNPSVQRGIKTPRPKLARPWPVTRFRHHMLRMLGRYRRPRCRHTNGAAPANYNTVKQNQIRPLANQTSTSSSEDDIASITSDSTNQSGETIFPTSVIRDGLSLANEVMAPPAMPPPTRRKIPNPTDLDELAETLGFSNIPSTGHRYPTSTNSIYRRQRRKHFLRQRSPTLSPIHESGLSNPTSPQPCRHSCSVSNSCSDSKSIITAGDSGRKK